MKHYGILNLVVGMALFLITTITTEVSGATASFQGLGDLPGGAFFSGTSTISADGSTVLGTGSDASGYHRFLWTQVGGMTAFSIPPAAPFTALTARALSGDGSVFVGVGNTASGFEAHRWSPTDGVTPLGDLPGGEYNSLAVAVSLDGSFVVGRSGIEPSHIFRFGPDAYKYEPFIWTAGGGMVGLGGFTGEPVGGEAADVSADGSVVVGRSTIITSPGEPWESYRLSAFRWTQTTGMTDLGFETAAAVSADGSTVVGYSQDDLGIYDAFRWTEESGRVFLGDYSSISSMSQAHDVTADGSVIVGVSWETGPPIPVIWDEVHGSRYLHDVLSNQYGLDLTGWSLEGAVGISDDGMTIAGTGINPLGDYEAFVATLPEPGAFGLLTVGVTTLLWRRG